MADIAATTGKNKWIWWAVSLLGLGAIGTAVWYFFFRKESKFAQNRLKAKGDSSTNTGTNTNTTTTEPQTQPQPQSQTTQVETPKVNTQTNTNPPPKTEKPKEDKPKEDKPKGVGDVYNDIFLKYREKTITSAPKNGAALVQYLINDLIGNYGINLPKLVVDGDFGKKSKTAFSAVMNKLYNKTGLSYPAESFNVGMFVGKYASSKNVVLAASESDIKALMGKVDVKKVFLS